MSRNKYTIPVNFTTTITVDVNSDDKDDVMANAEYEASMIFSNLMSEGSLHPSDFVAEVQEPQYE